MNPFFNSTNSALSQITKLYDFVWPTASAMWNFRWQIKGFITEVGEENLTEQDLLNRFDFGSRIHGVNLKKAFIEHSWENQQEEFAKFLLVYLFSIYESWISEIQQAFGINNNVAKSLQFSTQYDNNHNPIRGVFWGINQLNNNQSIIMHDAFYNTLTGYRKYSRTHLDNLLLCYRFFKESRNAISHNGGIADQKLIDAHQAFTQIAKPTDLGIKEVPLHCVPVLGRPILLNLRGVVGLSDVIIRIISTLDAELSDTSFAENEFFFRCQEWANLHPTDKRIRDINKPQGDRVRSIVNICSFPRAQNVAGIQREFIARGIIR
jgi:hypothetical protein